MPADGNPWNFHGIFFGLRSARCCRKSAVMHCALVMTVIGRDRPGLVETVARLVTEHGGNWLESRMSRLGGQFAGILRVHVPEARQLDLVRALDALKAQGLTVVVHPDAEGIPQPAARLMLMELVGQDQPGIVRQISRALAAHQVNVEELHTECASAPMSGEVLFKARAKLLVPPGCQLGVLRQDLEKIAADLIVDLTLDEAPAKV